MHKFIKLMWKLSDRRVLLKSSNSYIQKNNINLLRTSHICNSNIDEISFMPKRTLYTTMKLAKKSKKPIKKIDNSSSDSDDDDEEEILSPEEMEGLSDDEAGEDMGGDYRDIEFRHSTARVDAVAKAAFGGKGSSRSSFQEKIMRGRIRVNGNRVDSTAHFIRTGDVIDHLQVTPDEENYLLVNRVKIINIMEEKGKLAFSGRFYKNLKIRNQDDRE